IALVQRGPLGDVPVPACSFEEKINNAAAAGAEVVLVYNHSDGNISMQVGAATTPSYSMTLVEGAALRSFIDANGVNPTTVEFTAAGMQGNVLANFSLRGPTPAPLADLTKPDITAPGIRILA